MSCQGQAPFFARMSIPGQKLNSCMPAQRQLLPAVPQSLPSLFAALLVGAILPGNI